MGTWVQYGIGKGLNNKTPDVSLISNTSEIWMMEKKDTSSQAIPYTRGLVFNLINRYVYPSQAHASFTFVTVPKATSAFRLSFKDPRNCKMNMINNKLSVDQ
jgi:uncharacterized membrane protein YfhO